ncbi:MAG: class I SAM-dependent methyltransferase [Magnetococcales bacterium]|nr:class I SAM-dependent methyltransferase [Magnetococcales bacterium]
MAGYFTRPERKKMQEDDFLVPILVDNREWRKKCPERDSHDLLVAKEAQVLPKHNGVVRDPKIVDWVNCSICGKQGCRQLFCKQGFIYVQCENCDHVYVQNRIRYLNQLYKESEADAAFVKLQKNSNHLDYWTRVYKKYYSLMSNFTGPNQEILDIGCGVGSFLNYVNQHYSATNLHGLELNLGAAKYVKQIVGPDRFYDQPIEDVEFNTQFNQVYMWGVLEHLSDPTTVLKKIRDILSDQGYLLFLIPNFSSRAVKILGAQTPTFEPRNHIQFYTKKSLELLYKNVGLKSVGVYYELPVIDLMYPFIDYSKELALEISNNGEGYYEVHIAKKL